jgi:hypothetical protein
VLCILSRWVGPEIVISSNPFIICAFLAALVAAIRQLLNLFLIGGYAFRGTVSTVVPPPNDDSTGVTIGTKILVTLNAPAILWGGRVLQLEGEPLSNDFFAKTAVELIGRAGKFQHFI